jgi:hypothetical protein
VAKIVLLYNEYDRIAVSELWRLIQQRYPDLEPWFAPEDLDAFGTVFENIGSAIASATGVVFFIGAKGLGPFQENIEKNAVDLQRWKRGSNYGCLVVQLGPDAAVPIELQMFATIFWDPERSPEAIIDRIARAFRPRGTG